MEAVVVEGVVVIEPGVVVVHQGFLLAFLFHHRYFILLIVQFCWDGEKKCNE